MLRRHLRRCYLRSPEQDDSLMDLLCASMYRETVYLARLGFFARDIFLEHSKCPFELIKLLKVFLYLKQHATNNQKIKMITIRY